MKQLISCILLLINMLTAAAQKPPVDTTAFFNWPTISDWLYPAITNNGKYVMYSVRNTPSGSFSLVIRSLESRQEIALPGVRRAAFTGDSRRLVYMQAADSLCLLTLAGNKQTYLTAAEDFRLARIAGAEWLIYKEKGIGRPLTCYNLATGRRISYKAVANYLLDPQGKYLILQSTPAVTAERNISLICINLLTNKSQEIWNGATINDLHWDGAGKQLVFLGSLKNNYPQNIWLYKTGIQQAITRLNVPETAVADNITFDGIDGFSKDGSKLFLRFKQRQPETGKTGLASVNIWNYQDPKLQSQQLFERSLGTPYYLYIMNINSPSPVFRLQQENETVEQITDHYMIITVRKGERSEYYWNRTATGQTFLVNINTSQRTPLPFSIGARISPDQKYVTGYGPANTWHDIFCYEIATSICRNITAGIPIPQQDEENDMLLTRQSRGLFIAGWLPADKALLIYDNYDIWRVSPGANTPSRNLTKGRSRSLQFRLAIENEFSGKAINTSKQLILKAFNKRTKQSGFYSLILDQVHSPGMLYMGNCAFGKINTPGGQVTVLKALNADVYIVKREQAGQSPDIFYTHSLKNFSPVSEIYPENNINWLTAELINVNTSGGSKVQAILYKPENFDPGKKYPLIVHYYDKKTDQLNVYRHPLVDNGGELDIAWFVSHGYLVLLPDIHYTMGAPGESACNAVSDAVKYICQMPYVDRQHIGLQGHSFGGYETNYIITHSDLFAAAISSSGISNLTSDYGDLWPGNQSRQEYWEVRNGRVGTPPWESIAAYVTSSPVYYADQVTIPVLMVQNKNDQNVHFEQAVEFITALRRAGKKAWLLEYANGGHGVFGADYKDYLLRSMQFFDHYLKGYPAPEWMAPG